MSPASQKGLRLFSLLIAAIGLVFLIAGAWKLREDFSSQSWPTAEGRITQSEVSSFLRKKSKHEYRVKLNYEYKVGGTPYQGTRIGSAGSRYKTKAAADRALAPYPSGKTLPVHYDPARPEISRLETGLSGKTLLNLCIGLFLGLGGGLLAVLTPKIFR